MGPTTWKIRLIFGKSSFFLASLGCHEQGPDTRSLMLDLCWTKWMNKVVFCPVLLGVPPLRIMINDLFLSVRLWHQHLHHLETLPGESCPFFPLSVSLAAKPNRWCNTITSCSCTFLGVKKQLNNQNIVIDPTKNELGGHDRLWVGRNKWFEINLNY